MSETFLKTNRDIETPAIIRFVPESKIPEIIREGNRMEVPVNANWNKFKNAAVDFIHEGDSVLIHVSPDLDLDNSQILTGIAIKQRLINSTAESQGKHVLSRHNDGEWYLLNPIWQEPGGHDFAPQDDEVLEKFNRYETPQDWKKHQSDIWKRVAGLMPLAEAKFKGSPNHLADLTNPSRGLAREDVADFWSFRPGEVLNPVLMNDDMVGMPGMKGRTYEGFTITPKTGPNAGVRTPIDVKTIQTTGMPGIVIPMADENGNVAKFQIATDITKINVRLRPRAADGISIQHSEIYDKKKYMYTFLLDGAPSGLRIESASHSTQDDIRMRDAKGEFSIAMGEDIKDKLIDRGYEIPEIIDSLKVAPSAKYMWPSAGSMAGTKKVQNIVTPSDAGFIVAREPRNSAEDYVVVVTEGALKGHIVAKYLNSEDATGQSVGDFIAKDSGVIVAQVPGVAKAFVSSVAPIYDKYQVKGTYIAMDADGRENASVAKGIDTATKELSQYSAVKVMSWDPKHKGLDDALIAVGRHEIAVSDMDIHFGAPEVLFPIDKATTPNPYKLDGTRANKQQWQSEYAASKSASEAKLKKAQAANADRAKEVQEAGKDLEDVLPTVDEDALEQ